MNREIIKNGLERVLDKGLDEFEADLRQECKVACDEMSTCLINASAGCLMELNGHRWWHGTVKKYFRTKRVRDLLSWFETHFELIWKGHPHELRAKIFIEQARAALQKDAS